MRVMPREQQISRYELIRRCRQVAISISLALSIAACGGGGGGGGQPSAPAQQNPPPTTPANVAPTVEAGENQTIQLPTATVQLNGTASDDPSQTLAYTWSATSGPSGVTFGTPNAAATTATFPSEGTYVLTLSVTDGAATSTDTVTVTVNPAQAETAVYPASDLTNDSADHGWARVAAADVGMNQALLDTATTYAQASGQSDPADNAGMIIRGGRLVHSWGDIDKRYDVKSTTKSIGGMALGIAMGRGSVALTDTAKTHLGTFGSLPAANLSTPWGVDNITIQQLATHTAGFEKEAGLSDPGDPNAPTLDYEPGTAFFYSDGGLNWLADVLTAVFNEDLAAVLGANVWSTLGVNSSAGGAGNNGPAISDVHWRDNRADRAVLTNRELASGIFTNVNAMARVGLLFLRKGKWNDQQVLPESFAATVSTPIAANASLQNPQAADFPGAPAHYGVLWWTNADGQLPNVPRDAYWAWGLGDSLIVVIPSLDIVVVRAGKVATVDRDQNLREWNDGDWNGDYTVLAPFLDPIVQSVSQ